jgi:hypothetical protein
MVMDSFLFDAGSLFFLAWIAVLAGLSVTAFGRDRRSSNAHPDPVQDSDVNNPVHGATSRIR